MSVHRLHAEDPKIRQTVVLRPSIHIGTTSRNVASGRAARTNKQRTEAGKLLGHVEPPDLLTASSQDECRATGTAWCFFGANATSSSMQGKPEHVDQLAPGTITVHTQLCGRKVWKLRPHPLCPNWSDGAPLLSASWYGGRLELVCEVLWQT